MVADLTKILMTLVIFSGIVLGVSAFYGDIGNLYGIDSTNLSFLNRSKETAIIVEQLGNATVDPKDPVQVGAFIAWGGLNAIQLGASSIDLVSSLPGDASNPESLNAIVPVPPWVGIVITGAITVVIIMILLSAWLKFRV